MSTDRRPTNQPRRQPPRPPRRVRLRRLASPRWSALSFAAVPLYNWFCRTTGFGGTTQVATAAPAQISTATVTVRFDSNVAAGLPWRFEPERSTIDVKLGEVVTVYYTVTNEAARATIGQAGYNVSPPTAGIYFEKINCFCFTEQTHEAGREARHGGRLLCRSRSSPRIRSRTVSTPSRSPTPSIRCVAPDPAAAGEHRRRGKSGRI